VVVVNTASTAVYLFNKGFHREDWRGLVEYIEDRSSDKKSIVLFVSDSQMEAVKYYSIYSKISGPSGLSNDHDQIWLMRYVQPIFDPNDTLRKDIENLGYEKKEEHNFNGVGVYGYVKE
jgi:hypothetical protein